MAGPIAIVALPTGVTLPLAAASMWSRVLRETGEVGQGTVTDAPVVETNALNATLALAVTCRYRDDGVAHENQAVLHPSSVAGSQDTAAAPDVPNEYREGATVSVTVPPDRPGPGSVPDPGTRATYRIAVPTIALVGLLAVALGVWLTRRALRGDGPSTETLLRSPRERTGMHVVVNAATSVDGKLSTRERTQVAISGEADFERVDELRAASDAVMVGVGTVLADDPSLTVKSPERVREREARGDSAQPARVVADSRARTPPDAAIVDDAARTVVLASDAAPGDRRARLTDESTDVVVAGAERVDLAAALAELESRGVDDLMVEGGGELLFSLFDAGLVDELAVYVGSMLVGGRDAPTLVDGDGFTAPSFVDLELADVEPIDDGVLLSYHVED